MENFKVGQVVWFQNIWSNMIENGTVVEIEDNIATIETEFGNTGKKITDIYPSKDEAIKHINRKQSDRIDKIASKITNVEQLVKFMFDNNISHCEEYTDWTARKAVIKKAKELLNLNLE